MKRICALGFFDGVHLGHQKIIENAVNAGRETGLSPAVITFDGRPKDAGGPGRLCTGETRRLLIAELFGDVEVIELSLSGGLAKMAPEAFVQKILKEKFNAAAAVTGQDFRFGAGAEGTPARLRAAGLDTAVLEPVKRGGEPVSSTRIREHILAGEMAGALALLGHAHLISGEIVRGDARGRRLGFATVNIPLEPGILKPAPGVYASRLRAGGREYDAVTSFGTRPTFYENGEYLSETHVLEDCGELYGRAASLLVYDFLRPELKFPDAASLSAQIGADIENARKTLAGYEKGSVRI